MKHLETANLHTKEIIFLNITIKLGVMLYIFSVLGVRFMHCHVEQHLTWGMETAFTVKNGKHPEAQMLPPPSDMPPC